MAKLLCREWVGLEAAVWCGQFALQWQERPALRLIRGDYPIADLRSSGQVGHL